MNRFFYVFFWLSLGGLMATQFIVQFVIGRYANLDSITGLAIYNLYDKLIPFTVGFASSALVSVVILSIIKFKKETA